MALVRMMRKRQLEPESGHPACVNRRIPKADTSIAPLAAFSSAPPSAALFAGAIVGRGLLAADGRLAVPRAPSGSLHRIELSVQREPTNEYDPNALLWCCDAGPMGYATRTLAAAVTPLLSASKVRVVGLLRTQHARLAAADTKCNIAMDVVVHVVCPSILQRLHAAVEPSPGRPPLDVCVARLREAWLHDGVPFMPARAPMGATGVGALPPSAKRRRSMASVVGGVQQQTPSPTIPGGNQMRLTGSLSGRRGPAVQASSCDVARHFPKRVLVLLFSSPGLSVRDVVLGARGVCRAWRDAADSPDCAPARRAFALLHHTFSGATPSPSAAPGTALAAAVPVATAEDARPPSLPAWASEPLPTSFETLMRWVAAAQPLSCDMAWLVAQWATGQFPVPSSGPAASQAVLLRRIMEAALEQLPPLRRAVGGWAAICAMLLFTTEDVARRLLWVLFTCPAKVSHSAAAAGLRDFPWRQDVINVVYLLLLALSSPEWLRVGPTPGGVTGGSFGELGRTKALLTLEAREDLVARSRVMCHALNVGSTVAVAGSVGPYPSFDSPGCVVAGVPPDMCSTMARGMSRKLHAPPHDLCQIPNSSTHIRQRASPVVRAVKHQHPAAEDEEEETLQRAATSATPRSLLDVLRVPDSYHDLLARADGRTQFLLACMRSAENPLGGLSSSPSSRGAWALKVSPAATGETKSRRLTEEQLSIVQTDVGPGQLLRVLAFAGSGKTTTLIEYATARQHKRMLYLVFNVSVREDAEGRFPPNVTVKSIHQLAFAEVGRRYSGRRQLVSELSTKMITRALGLGSGSGMFELATWVKDTVLQFCHSVDRAMHLHHLPAAVAGRLPTGFTLQQALRMVPKRQPGDAPSRQSFDARHVLGFAQRLWDAMVDLADQSVSMTHAGYLKLFHLSKPDLGKHFAAILLDEAQDCAPVVADTVLSQSCGVVLVGDPHQSVYSFAGAVDTLSASFSASASGRAGWDPLHGRTVTVRRLTRSFRFGPNIARAAASILRCRKLEPEPLIGLPLAVREDRVRLETPAPMHSAQGMLPPRMVGTMLASQRIVSAIDSPLHPWLLHARRAGFLRRLLNASDVQRVLAATKEGKEAPELSGPSASTPWTVALLARGNVTLMFLAWQLTTLCVDSSKPRHLPPHPSLLQKKYERAHRDGLKSVAIAKPVHTGRCPRIGVLGMNDRNPADHAFGMRQLEDVCCLALKVKSLIDSPLIRAFNSLVALQAFAEATGRVAMKSQVALVSEMGPAVVLSVIYRVRWALVGPGEGPDIVLGTVHKAKGLEFDEVILADDFGDCAVTVAHAQFLGLTLSFSNWREEQNLLYVASTRAKHQLWANNVLTELLLASPSTSSPCLVATDPSCTASEPSASGVARNAMRDCTRPAMLSTGFHAVPPSHAHVHLLAPPLKGSESPSPSIHVIPVQGPLPLLCELHNLRAGAGACASLMSAMLRQDGLNLAGKPGPEESVEGIDSMEFIPRDRPARVSSGSASELEGERPASCADSQVTEAEGSEASIIIIDDSEESDSSV